MSLKSKFSKKKVLLYAFVAMIAWTYTITIMAGDLAAIPYYFQFLLVSGVMYAFPSIILGGFVSNARRKIVGTWLFLMACDLVFPPLIISLGGVHTPTLLSTASPDYFFFMLWSSAGLDGSLLFLAVYPLTAVILLGVAVGVLSEKQIKSIVD